MHHKYIEIHYLIVGIEQIEIADEDEFSITDPYDENKDYVLGEVPGTRYILKERVPFVVMPGEAHLPELRLGERIKVKKVVVKVPL